MTRKLHIPRAGLRLATFTLALAAASQVSQAASPQGVWLDHSGRGAVEIKPCGGAWCGHVVWVKNASDTKGCGHQIIGDATPANGKYTGWIYSPEDRKRYNVELAPQADGRLKLVGYAGIRLFSKTMFWKPAAANLVRCDASPAPKAEPGVTAAAAPEPAPAASKAPPASPAMAPAPAPKTAAAAPPAPVAKETVAPPSPAPQASQAKPASPETATAPADEAAAPADEAETAGADGKPDLDRLARVIDKVVKRTPGGGCKLDLPWVKVEFRCEEE